MQKLTWQLARFFDPANAATLQLEDGARLRVRLSDGYWTRLLVPGYEYEPEIARVLFPAIEAGAYFLDLGSNVGYWSIRAKARGVADAVAVEAAPPNYAQLRANVALNDSGITPLLNAIWSKDDEQIQIVTHERRHAGNSVVDRASKADSPGYATHQISTITIDTLVQKYCPDAARQIVIKLDVEGAEIDAIRGAANTLAQRNVTILYEDHGQDRDCTVSQFLQDQGLLLYSGGRRVSVDEIKAMKTSRSSGYNFVAKTRGH